MKSLIASFVALVVASSAFAQVSTTGTGTVFVKPDCVLLVFNVVTDDVSASKAHADNRTKSNNLFALIRKHKVEDKDVRTAQFNIHPNYDDKGVFKSYTVNHSVMVKVRDMPNAGAIIDEAADAHSQLKGIRFEVADRTSWETKARDLALADAKRKAEQMVGGLGEKLGRLKSVSDAQVYRGYSEDYAPRAARMTEGAAPTQLGSGEQAITVNVSAVWDLGSGVSELKKTIKKELKNRLHKESPSQQHKE